MAKKSVGKHEVNDELIRKLDKGEITFAELDEETTLGVDAYLASLDEAAPAEGGEAQPKPEVVAESKEDEPAKPPKGFVEGTKYKEKADAASDFENKWKAERERVAALEAKLKAREVEPIKPPTPDVLWSDKGQADLHTTVAELKRRQDEFEAEQRSGLEAIKTEKLKLMNETELQMLRANPLFKESVPQGSLEDMEAAYSAFYYATGATAEDSTPVKKYFSDPEFRKSLEAKGVKPPQDFEKINEVLQVKALRDKYRAVDPDFKMSDAYVNFMAKNKKLDTLLVGERLKGAAQVADKLHGIANETITMPPGQTSASGSDQWSDAQIKSWFDKHPHPKTKDEIATFNRICEILDAREAQAQ